MTYSTLCLATDLESQAPWHTAWRLAALARAELVAVHLGGPPDARTWDRLQPPAELMQRWDIDGRPRADGFDGDGWRGYIRTVEPGEDTSSLAFWVRFARPDLLIVGTHRRGAASRLLQPSTGELLARTTPSATLVIPDGVTGLVEPATGLFWLERVLVPVGDGLDPSAAVDAVARLAESTGRTGVQFVFLHIGAEGPPPIDVPDRHKALLSLGLTADGPIAQHITRTASDLGVDLIALVTRGHDSWMDSLLGSHTDQVIRRSPVPVLVVPQPPIRQTTKPR